MSHSSPKEGKQFSIWGVRFRGFSIVGLSFGRSILGLGFNHEGLAAGDEDRPFTVRRCPGPREVPSKVVYGVSQKQGYVLFQGSLVRTMVF